MRLTAHLGLARLDAACLSFCCAVVLGAVCSDGSTAGNSHQATPGQYEWKKKTKIRETGIPNNSVISVFTFYFSNFVYWIGFVTGVTFLTHLRIVDFIDFWLVGGNQPLSLGCYSWEKEFCFLNLSFALSAAKPLHQNVCIDHRIIFTLGWSGGKSWLITIRILVFEFSLILDFSAYFNYLSRMTFWGWKTPPPPPPPPGPTAAICGM